MVILNGAKNTQPSGLATDARMVELVALWACQPPDRRRAFLEEYMMPNVDEQLRRAIAKNCPMSGAGESYYALAKRAGVSGEQISRYMAGERDLRFATAAKLADALGLELVAHPAR